MVGHSSFGAKRSFQHTLGITLYVYTAQYWDPDWQSDTSTVVFD